MAISCSVWPDVCPGVCYCLGGKRERIQHHPQNCYLKPRVAAECLLLGNSFKLARTSLEPSRKCWAVVIPCDFVWALQTGSGAVGGAVASQLEGSKFDSRRREAAGTGGVFSSPCHRCPHLSVGLAKGPFCVVFACSPRVP